MESGTDSTIKRVVLFPYLAQWNRLHQIPSPILIVYERLLRSMDESELY